MLTSVFAFDTFAFIPNVRSICNYNRITAIVFLLVCGCRSSPFCCSGMIVLVKLTIFLMANLTFSLFYAGRRAALVIASVSALGTNTVCKLVNFVCNRYSTATSICFAMVCIGLCPLGSTCVIACVEFAVLMMANSTQAITQVLPSGHRPIHTIAKHILVAVL